MVTVSRILQRASIFMSPVTRFFLAGPLHRLMSRNLLLLSFNGRVTGRWYKTPVSYVRDGDDLLIPGGGKWWKNLAAGPVSVRLRGEWRLVTAQVISDREVMAESLARMIDLKPIVSLFTGIRRGPDRLPDPESLDRERKRGFVVVRLQLTEDSPPTVQAWPVKPARKAG